MSGQVRYKKISIFYVSSDMCANFDMVVCSLGKRFHRSKVPTKKTSQTDTVEGDIITLSERLLIAVLCLVSQYSTVQHRTGE